jgi:hypothetical protein
VKKWGLAPAKPSCPKKGTGPLALAWGESPVHGPGARPLSWARNEPVPVPIFHTSFLGRLKMRSRTNRPADEWWCRRVARFAASRPAAVRPLAPAALPAAPATRQGREYNHSQHGAENATSHGKLSSLSMEDETTTRHSERVQELGPAAPFGSGGEGLRPARVALRPWQTVAGGLPWSVPGPRRTPAALVREEYAPAPRAFNGIFYQALFFRAPLFRLCCS